MKSLNRWMWAMVAVMAVGFASCGGDEPSPNPPNPDQPQQPDKPNTPAKDWQGETPHGFLLDVTNVSIPVSERGFLQRRVRDKETGEYKDVDEVIMDYNQSAHSVQKMMTTSQPIALFNLTCEGTLADPFENVEKYRATCAQLGFRPKSQFSEFPELMELPTPEMDRVYMMDEVTSIEVITEKNFDASHPAGSSMAIADVGSPGIGIWVMPGKPQFDMWKQGQSLDGYGGPGYILNLGVCDKKWSTYPGAEMSMNIFGYPQQAGEYPMTLKITFANSGTKVFKFTVKYVDKK